MVEVGYALSSEEHGPRELVGLAARAEEAGFTFALISDHFHPWTDRQGHSPFVWTVIGGIAVTTKRLRLGTGVTCPTMRIHPAIIAQAAATAAEMMPGRFFLGVGTGENLNEHIMGAKWPAPNIRLQMLDEALALIRLLWRGGTQSFEGRFYTVENARVYTLPAEPPPIFMAAGGKHSARTAGEIADGFIGTAPDPGIVEAFEVSGGRNKPRYAKITVCWADTEDTARTIAHRWWPTAAVPGELGQELPLPAHFEQAAELVTPDMIGELLVCGPDPAKHIERISQYIDAGYDHIYAHQVGPDQEGFFRFYEREVLPNLPADRPAGLIAN